MEVYQAFKEHIREQFNPHGYPIWNEALLAQYKEPSSLFENFCTHMQSQYVSFNFWVFYLFVLQSIIILLIMVHINGYSDRPARSFLFKRVVGFITICAVFSLIWFNAGSEGQLRKTYTSVSKQVEKSAASALGREEQPDIDGQLKNVTTPSTNIFLPAPFPTLPPPDDEEYMAICMAGEYLYACRKNQSSRVVKAYRSEEPILGPPRVLYPLLFPPRHSPLLHFRRRYRASAL